MLEQPTSGNIDNITHVHVDVSDVLFFAAWCRYIFIGVNMATDNRASGNQVCYLGIAATDKAEDSIELEVWPLELLPGSNGNGVEAVAQDNEVTVDGVTHHVTTANTIRAQWDGDTVVQFPPMVRKGEQVYLMEYGTNQWYWKSAGRDDGCRRLDSYRLGVSGSLENNAEITDDNTYFIEMNTRTAKHIKISTSAADGEEHRYTLLLNAATSEIHLADDYGNQLSIESNTPRVCLKNHNNTLVDLNKDDIFLAAPRNITLISKTGDISFVTQSGNINTSATGGDIVSQTDQDITTTCQANHTTKVNGETKWMSQGSAQFSSNAAFTIQSVSTMTLASGGSLSISFTGTGTCTSSGGSLTMKMKQLAIEKG